VTARRGRRPGPDLAAAIALLAAVLAGPPAEAHAYLVRSSPPHRAVLARAPERVDLWFNEGLEAAYSTASVWSEGGAQVDARDVAGSTRSSTGCCRSTGTSSTAASPSR
jgi:methionine-rich copper-binding protein CopC